MIITDNYILEVFNKDGETYIFSYETPDVWTALKEFWHEDYEHIACNDSWDIDAYAMENGKVIDTYKFHLCTSAFHHFFDNGHITINEFKDLMTREEDDDEDKLRQIWMDIGVTIEAPAEKIEQLIMAEGDEGEKILLDILKSKQFVVEGFSYIPSVCMDEYNERYGTDHPLGDYEYNMSGDKI